MYLKHLQFNTVVSRAVSTHHSILFAILSARLTGVDVIISLKVV